MKNKYIALPKCLFKLSTDGGCVGTVHDRCKNCDARAKYILDNQLYKTAAIKPIQTVQEDKPKSVDSDFIEVIKCEGKPLPTTANKEVEINQDNYKNILSDLFDSCNPNVKLFDYTLEFQEIIMEALVKSFKLGQQSLSSSKDLTLLIEAAKYGYEYHSNSQFPEMTFEDNCKNNLLQWLQNKQIQPISKDLDSIVGFILEYVNKNTVLSPKQKILNMKPDIIKQLSNGK